MIRRVWISRFLLSTGILGVLFFTSFRGYGAQESPQSYHAAVEEPDIEPPQDTQNTQKFQSSTKAQSALKSAASHFHINGFASAGGVRTTSGAKYLIPEQGAVSNEWNFAAKSLIGLQIALDLVRNLSVVTQIVADGDDTNGNKAYQPSVQWAYLRYSPTENHQVNFGRFRLPAFLFSETQQVGYSFPWMFVPNEVYALTPFYNVNGASYVYNFPISTAGLNFTLQPFYGSNSNEQDLYTNGGIPVPPYGLHIPIPQGTTARLRENHIAGFVASFGNQVFLVRGSYTHFQLSANLRNFGPLGGADFTLYNKQTVSLLDLAARVNYKNILVIGEVAHRGAPNQINRLTGFYLMGGYRLGQFLPNITYARASSSNTNNLTPQPYLPLVALGRAQQSFTASLAYYLNNHLVTKANVSVIEPLNGTIGFFNRNPGKSVLFYGVGIDAIF